MRMRLRKQNQLLLGIGLILIQVLLFQTFSWIAIPSWQENLKILQIGVWVFHCVLLIYLLYSVTRTLAELLSRAEKRQLRLRIKRSGIYLGIIVIELIVISTLSFFSIAIIYFGQIKFGFFCGEYFEEINLNLSSKIVYIEHIECKDGYLNGGTAYIQESKLPVMKPLFEASEGSIKLSQYSIYVKLSTQYTDSSKSVFYNVKTGELSDEPPY